MPTHPSLNRLATNATAHCLTGCGIGEILGLVLATWRGWSNTLAVAVAVVLAFAFGYAFTLGPLIRAGLPPGTAARLALAADTVSITVMEIADNAVMLVIPGAIGAGLTDLLFWGSLALSLAASFVAAWPVNRWLIAKDRGHAVVHAYHDAAGHRTQGRPGRTPYEVRTVPHEHHDHPQ